MRKHTMQKTITKRLQGRRLQDDKLRELILYIARESEGDPSFGATKLNKLLFYADFLAYKHLGGAITKQEYQALDQGPAPRKLVPLLQKMEKVCEVATQKTDYHNYTQNRTIALRTANLDRFKPEEVVLVSRIIRQCWGKTARHMSDLSHQFIGWRLANIGDTIPYPVALISEREPTKTEINYARSLQSLAKKCLSSNVT